MSDSRNPEQIRNEIEETRQRVSQDIDEVGRRLSREGLKEETRSAIAGAEDVVVNATREVADRAMRRADEMGGRFAERLADSPVPVALIGLGLGWMLMRADEARRDPDSARSRAGGMGVRAAYRAGREEGARRARREVEREHAWTERAERSPAYGSAYELHDEDPHEEMYVDEDGYVYVYDYDEDASGGGWIGTAVTVGAGLLVAGAAALAVRAMRSDDEDAYDAYYGARHSGLRVRDGFVVDEGDGRRALPAPTYGRSYGRSERGRSDRAFGSARTGPARSVPYSYDDDKIHFQAHHRSLHPNGETPFSEAEADYRFGARLGNEDRLADRHWDQVEEQIRQRWESRGRTDWERHRDAIRYGFERARIASHPSSRSGRLP